MDTIQLAKEIINISKRIEKGVDRLHAYGVAYAESEREYRKALAIEIVKLKDQGVKVTLIGDIARGNTAELKFKRDLAEQEYKVARDMLNALQAELSGLQTVFRKFEEI